ncbi:MAG: valine--tRNA ligase [Patescibacteria group bacterium]
MFDKPYDPKEHESRIYSMWEKSGYFNPDNLPAQNDHTKGGLTRNYIVYMPLPNVTGTLHMGHLLDNTIQDIVIRYHRMRGYRTLWFPGTDHAGIATQYVVEKELKKGGVSRFELGREKFIERVWEWKKKYGGLILEQLRKLGASADWSRLRFTMDPEYAKDVLGAFVHYHEKGLLYRGKRVVNWCTRCGTSLSELELDYADEETKLWFIRYSDALIVATTRPETMLGDTAVAVNPTDRRYMHLIGSTVTLPIQNRKIPVIADMLIDPKFGTGAVKVTPAHDMADYEISERNKLPMIQVIDERGKMTEIAGEAYKGMKTSEARKKVVENLRTLGLLIKEEAYPHRVAKCYRCGTVIEPIPSAQWFIKMKELAKSAIQAVTTKKVRIIPDRFEKPYFDWLGTIRDWAVSRQIWWGHRLPVWFCKNDKEKYVVNIERPAVCEFCNACEMEQSEDVLDTWFSSALWPFAGLSESDLKVYYPGTTLITARDILNLWVARMIYSGLEFQHAIPFTNVFIHGTILTKDGKRMSKSLGTGIDPLKYIDTHGADAARFGIIWQASGQDIHWDEAAVMAGKKFANKIWNAARFVTTQTTNFDLSEPMPRTEADRKILEALATFQASIEKDMAEFEMSKILHNLYDFFWHLFCDVYLEASKKQMVDPELKKSTQTILAYILLTSLRMLHPFMPFVTETIYQELPLPQKTMLMVELW